MNRHRITALALTLSAIAGLAVTPPAPAQVSGSMSWGHWSPETFRPRVTRREIEVMGRILKLRPDERSSVVALFEAHDAEVRAEGGAIRRACRDLSEEAELTQRQTVMEGISKKVADWEKRREELEKQFLADLTSMLTKEQNERWPTVERELRRPRLMDGAWMSGEGIDVVALVADTISESDHPPEIDELLERYASEVDPALVERERFVKAHDPEMADLVKSDPQKALSYRKDSVRNRVRIREINERWAKQIASRLAPDPGRRLLDAFERRCITWWNHETPMEMTLKAARSLDNLSADARKTIGEIEREYRDQAVELTRRTVTAYQKYEQDRVPESIAEALGMEVQKGNTFSTVADDHPLHKARLDRMRLDRDTRRRLAAVITTEQMAELEDKAESAGGRFFTLDDSPRL